VHIRHKVIAVEFVGPGAPILDGAQIVAQVQIAAGLDAREHHFLFRFFHIETQPFYQDVKCRPVLPRSARRKGGTM